jgi:LysM repeat protein
VRTKVILGGLIAFGIALGQAVAQDAPARAAAPAAPAGALQTGPATVAPHWSRNKFPESIPEGATYYIVERGDTLWDISARFLGNAYLWPQIWDENKYIADAHWIYPGDPLILPKVALVAAGAGQAGAGAEGLPGEAGAEGMPGEGGIAGAGPAAAALVPVTEEVTLQCADYIVQDREDESLEILGSEQGNTKIALAERDIVYLTKGSNSGVKAGELYAVQHASYTVRHPASGKKLGTKIETVGWLQVILVQENSATGVVEVACLDLHAGDYLKPFEKVNVPLVVTRPPATRLTPPSGKLNQYVVDIAMDASIAAEGHLLSIDAGSESGVAPGNVFSVYRIDYPSVPTPRNVIGEVTIVSVREKTATAKVTYSADAIMVGDMIELR